MISGSHGILTEAGRLARPTESWITAGNRMHHFLLRRSKPGPLVRAGAAHRLGTSRRRGSLGASTGGGTERKRRRREARERKGRSAPPAHPGGRGSGACPGRRTKRPHRRHRHRHPSPVRERRRARARGERARARTHRETQSPADQPRGKGAAGGRACAMGRDGEAWSRAKQGGFRCNRSRGPPTKEGLP